MKILDYHRSFFWFEVDYEKKAPKTVSDKRQNPHNRARIRIDCLCRITTPKGKTTDYFLGEACKTERVCPPKGMTLFMQPNADFRPVFSNGQYGVIFKSWDKNNKGVMLVPPSLGPQPERQIIDLKEVFYRFGLILRHRQATPLRTTRAIIAATDSGKPLVARTEFKKADYKVVLEYPIVTFNVSEKYMKYQTDTGPVLFPEGTRKTKRVEDTFRLAFSAFNGPHWIEFIVQKPTPLGNGISVNHYSENVQVDAKNTIFAES
jgi:hypothetical protein